jgi:UDP-hydrolysing UDP-N-acetyl-D-glucosamine 2-epimerase
MRAIEKDPLLELHTVVGGAILGQSYGDYRPIIAQDGFSVTSCLDYLGTEANLESISQSAARCMSLFAEYLSANRPDIVVIVADRYEALALAQAALCMNVRIAHLEGGEVSGSIDERIRHSITKLAHVHFPSNREAADRILMMGESEESIHVVGTPSLDQICNLSFEDLSDVDENLVRNGHGPRIDLDRPYLVVSFHPVVTEIESVAAQYQTMASVVFSLQLPTVWILPNLDAGFSEAREVSRKLQSDPNAPAICSVGSLPIELYAKLIKRSVCLVGNSSSGIRECAFLGVPSVNIGTRQTGRLRGENVRDVADIEVDQILDAIYGQIGHGPYKRSELYGDGRTGNRIAAVLAGPLPRLDKTIAY